MTDPSLAFFTIDRGNASTAASIIGRHAGRWRLLAAGAVPASVPDEILLEDLVAGIEGADAEALAAADPWQSWTRIESVTRQAPLVALAATTDAHLGALERVFGDAGWRIAARITPDNLQPLAVAAALLDRHVGVVAIAAGDPLDANERPGLADLASLIGGLAMGRADLRVVLAGGAVAEEPSIPGGEVVRAASSLGGKPADQGSLASLAERLLDETGLVPSGLRAPAEAGSGTPADGRRGFARAIASLAAVLDLRVEGVDIGIDGGTRVVASPDGIERCVVRADGALVPAAALEDERLLDQIASWTTVEDDAFALRDRLRNLRLAPWRDAAGDGAVLRVGAVRAALERLCRSWEAGGPAADRAAAPDARLASPDLLVVSGGAFALAPAPVVALAVIDTLRHPGGVALAFDHARALAPLGGLADEIDRRRILTDVADDLLAPLGSTIVAGGLRGGRRGTLRLTSDGVTSGVPLLAGAVQVVDLPPGIAARAELEAPDDLWVGVHARRVAIDVVGGLGGLLVDTRETPLRLPDRPERRRELLGSWERPLWIGADR